MLVIDTETTGTSRDDRIIELAILSGDAVHSWRFNPGVPIPAEATAVHGITDADVADAQPFTDQAADVLSHLQAAPVIAGFNLRFDLSILQSEIERAGLPPLDLSRVVLLDAMRLWQHFEPRTLAAAHEKFCGSPIAKAHTAAGDVQATGAVLAALVERFGLSSQVPIDLAKLCDPLPERHDWCGPTPHLRWKDGVVVFGVGKHEGKPVASVPRDYLEWVTRNSFPQHVKDTCRVAIVRPEELNERCRRRFT